VHPDAYIAPTAVLAGDVRIGANSCLLFGAVLTDDGGPVEIGTRCVIMEHAVVRGTPRHGVTVGRRCAHRPARLRVRCLHRRRGLHRNRRDGVQRRAHGARRSSVALGGAVHIGAHLGPEVRVPLGWVAVGNPARLHPIEDVEAIRDALEDEGGFLPFVFGVDPALARPDAMRVAMSRYTAALAAHRTDKILE
jgi:hypothetical protein